LTHLSSLLAQPRHSWRLRVRFSRSRDLCLTF
jgi:hypothetical protein